MSVVPTARKVFLAYNRWNFISISISNSVKIFYPVLLFHVTLQTSNIVNISQDCINSLNCLLTQFLFIVSKKCSQSIKNFITRQVWWYMSIIQPNLEVDTGGPWFKASLGNVSETICHKLIEHDGISLWSWLLGKYRQDIRIQGSLGKSRSKAQDAIRKTN
jgi:hypothetical protein